MNEALNYCFKFVGETAKTWQKLNYDNKLRFQKNVFAEKILFDGKKFGTKKLARIYSLNREYADKKSNLVAPRGIEPLFVP